MIKSESYNLYSFLNKSGNTDSDFYKILGKHVHIGSIVEIEEIQEGGSTVTFNVSNPPDVTEEDCGDEFLTDGKYTIGPDHILYKRVTEETYYWKTYPIKCNLT